MAFSIMWFTHDGWHVHVTSRGLGSRITLSTMFRDGGGVAVKVEAYAGMVTLTKDEP